MPMKTMTRDKARLTLAFVHTISDFSELSSTENEIYKWRELGEKEREMQRKPL